MSLLAGLRLPWQPKLVPPTSGELDRDEAEFKSARVWMLGATSEREVHLRLVTPRVSDSLNDDGGVWIREQGFSSEGWSHIERGEVLLVIPPDHSTDRLQRLHRTARRVCVVVGPYVIVGSAHVQPGADPVAFLGRHGRAFVPLTGASLRRGADELGVLPAVIVNLREASQVATPDLSARQIAGVEFAT